MDIAENATAISDAPADVLELEDSCAADLTGEYDLNFHIVILFVIMLCSFVGTMLPVIGRKVKILGKITDLPFQCGKMFGAGVILATAWVHMYSPADKIFANPCLPALFTETYTGWAGALALLAALSTHLIQFFASRAIRSQLGKGHQQAEKVSEELGGVDNQRAVERSSKSPVGNYLTAAADMQSVTVSSQSPLNSHNAQPVSYAATHKGHDAHAHNAHDHATADEHGHHLILIKEKHVTTYILELGIASHSIIIGLALGVARGAEVRSLAIALVFHQFFEGLALSTVVLESQFEKHAVTIAMVLFYTLTTPIGVAIGIGASKAYNENGQTALLTQGILDSLSAGILTYDALVNIIFMHFAAPALRSQSDFSQFMQLGSLWLGAFCMALIGRWA